MEHALYLENVSKTYPDFKLDNVSLSLPKGAIMGFIGANGAGKSTTIKLILDLVHRESGSITILGRDNLKQLDSIKEHIGVVLDESGFPENLSADDVDRILRRIYRTWDSGRFLKYLREFSLPKGKAVKTYSKGMKMKLSIAAALSHDSQLLILDEATSGLDPVVRDELQDVFLNFIQDEQCSILMSSHILSDLDKICDYITFIHKGKIHFSETKESLMEKYGLLKCSLEDFERLDSGFVLGSRKNQFGVEVLVDKQRMERNLLIDPVSIEDIMVFTVKESRP